MNKTNSKNEHRRSAQSPAGYLITFTCYGTWLHGESPSSVDKQHNNPGDPFLQPNLLRAEHLSTTLKYEPLILNKQLRETVLEAIIETCRRHERRLYAVHVRTEHVHIVVQTNETPEHFMSGIKTAATRELKNSGVIRQNGCYWTRHGSTKYLWSVAEVEAATIYVIYDQGDPMALYVDSNIKCVT